MTKQETLSYPFDLIKSEKNPPQSPECHLPGLLYSAEQRSALEEYFCTLRDSENVDTEAKLKELSAATRLTREQILMWVRNRKTRGVYKGRIVHNVHQVRVLEWIFTNHTQYPSFPLKKRMADYLKMSYLQLQKWFQSRRQRGPTALLTHRMQFYNKEEWDQTIKEVRVIIDEAEEEEFQ